MRPGIEVDNTFVMKIRASILLSGDFVRLRCILEGDNLTLVIIFLTYIYNYIISQISV